MLAVGPANPAYLFPRFNFFLKSEPMVNSADEPECIHREPRQGEYAGKPYFASSQRRARSYAQYSVFQTPGPRASRSQALIG
jgi:hypothetical protein